jgi:hypothetical protein
VRDELEILKLRAQLRELGSTVRQLDQASTAPRHSFCFRASGPSLRI